MIDISQTVAPKSDQLNADDLIAGPRTIRVTRVSKMSEPDQPIAIYFEGDNGKPYKPGKSMRRVLLLLPRAWRLTAKEEQLLRALRAVGPNILHHERAMLTLYGMWEDMPEQKILDVMICKIRRKLMEA